MNFGPIVFAVSRYCLNLCFCNAIELPNTKNDSIFPTSPATPSPAVLPRPRGEALAKTILRAGSVKCGLIFSHQFSKNKWQNYSASYLMTSNAWKNLVW